MQPSIFYIKLNNLKEKFSYDNKILNNFEVKLSSDLFLYLFFINSQEISMKGYNIPFIRISQDLNVVHDFFFYKIEVILDSKIIEKREIFASNYDQLVKILLDMKDKLI